MLVPRTRALALAAAVLLPASLAYAAAPGAAVPLAAVALAFLLLAACDAALAPRALRGLTIALPPVVRLTRNVPGMIDVSLADPRGTALALRLGLALPSPFALEEERDVLLPAGEERSRVAWEVTSRRRGRFLLDTCAVEASSPAGLFSLRARLPVSCEVRVYPNLQAERRALASVFLSRGGAGAHAQRLVGRGREFEKLREYVPGDGFDEIHWKATARRGRPITKVYQVERTQEVYVVLDASRLSMREVGGRGAAQPTIERFVSAALVLALAAEKQGDLFGLVTFDAQVRTFLRARSGTAHARACREALATVEAVPAAPDFDELATFLRLKLRRRALLLFLTELDDPALADAFTKAAGLLSRQNLVVAHGIRPPAARPLFTEDAADVDEVYERLGGHLVWRSLRELAGTLGRLGVRLTLLSADSLATELVASYMTIKRRQLL
jgi:uncharacterized protein (DUF58 family)